MGIKEIPISLIPTFLINEDIHYLVPYDSTVPGVFNGETLLKAIQKVPEGGIAFEYDEIKLESPIEEVTVYRWPRVSISPTKEQVWLKFTFLKKFERYNQSVYLYRADWEKR